MVSWAGGSPLRMALAILLILHGTAHLVGFVVPWELMKTPAMPYRTTILNGAVDVGEGGVRLLGLGWLALAMAMAGLGLVLLSVGWFSFPTMLAIVGVSLVFCVLEWPEARIGVAVNLAIVALICAAGYFSWVRPS